MAVIISELEIIPEPDQPRDKSEAAARREAAPRPLRPEDIVLIARHEADRGERLRAD